MKAIQIQKFGGPEVLELIDIEIGKPGPKEVLMDRVLIYGMYQYNSVQLLYVQL